MRDYVENRIGRPLLPAAALPKQAVPLLVSDVEIKVQRIEGGKLTNITETVTLTLCRGCAFFHEKALAQAVPDASVRDGVQSYVHAKDLTAFKAQVAASAGKLSVKLDGHAITLEQGKHFFLSGAEALRQGGLAAA